ncbi:hypothetical protein LguiA_007218 [Lonicera macranthoides]
MNLEQRNAVDNVNENGYIYALEVFDNMLASEQTPNEITFVSMISACTHDGLVSEGQNLFNKMINCCSLKRKIEHYGCMVDLLG